MSSNFIFLGTWYDKLSNIKDEEKRKDFAWRILRYGATGELDPTGDEFADAWLKTICDYVDKKKDDYENKKQIGRSCGRTPSFDREELKRLIAAGKTAKSIADSFGVDPSSIYHDSVWKDRKKHDMYRNL